MMPFGYNPHMRIDPAVCEKILIAVESDPQAGTGQGVRIAVEDSEPKLIAHHISYLIDVGMLKGIKLTNFQSPCPEFTVTDITPQGRAYLDEREPEVPRRKIGF
jgi:hypothetical protein